MTSFKYKVTSYIKGCSQIKYIITLVLLFFILLTLDQSADPWVAHYINPKNKANEFSGFEKFLVEVAWTYVRNLRPLGVAMLALLGGLLVTLILVRVIPASAVEAVSANVAEQLSRLNDGLQSSVEKYTGQFPEETKNKFYDGLSAEDKTLVELRVANDGKSMLLAYVLFIFFGWLGAHRIYIGRVRSGIAQLVIFLVGSSAFFSGLSGTAAVGIAGLLLIGVLGFWILFDLFIIPKMVDEERNELREKLSEGISEKPE